MGEAVSWVNRPATRLPLQTGAAGRLLERLPKKISAPSVDSAPGRSTSLYRRLSSTGKD